MDQRRSFTRASPRAGSASHLAAPGAKPGPHATALLSSGILDLDSILGGGIPVGGIVLIAEDLEGPHHLLLLRYFLAQGLVHRQPLLFASPLPSPKAFLGTLPGLAKEAGGGSAQEDKLRIAWQYKKYLEEGKALEERRQQQQAVASRSVLLQDSQLGAGSGGGWVTYDYCTSFDLRRPMERTMLNAARVEYCSLQSGAHLSALMDQCSAFLHSLSRPASGSQQLGRIALHSLCAPEAMQRCTVRVYDLLVVFFVASQSLGTHQQFLSRYDFGILQDWELLAFLADLKAMLRASNAAAVVSFPAALLKPSFRMRWQHLSDILLFVEACPDDSKELASLLTGYQDIVGFLRVHKLATINTQVPHIPETATYAIKVPRRKALELERLQQAPVDATGGASASGSIASMLCGGPPNATGHLEF